MLISPNATHNKRKGKPKVTPIISGIVLFIPKLNPESNAIKLFGPGVKAATTPNNVIDNISGCIFYAMGSPFSDF